MTERNQGTDISLAAMGALVERLRARVQELEREVAILQEQIDEHYIPRVVGAEGELDAKTGQLGNTIGEQRMRISELEREVAEWKLVANAAEQAEMVYLKELEAVKREVAELRKGLFDAGVVL